MASPDALIIGGGIVGAACARTLTEAGMQVLVLEAEFIGAGVTAAGMGHLVVMDDSEDQLALTQFSLRLWEELAPELPVEVEWDPCGTLWLAEDEAQLETVHRKQALYARVGVATEVLEPTQLAAAEPSLRHGLAGALRVPGDRVIYPTAAARWLIEEATRAGAQLRERTRVHQIHPGGWVTLDSGERIAAGIIINAAGAAAASLTPGLPIVPRRGHLAITERYPGFCQHQLVELGYLTSAHQMTEESVAFNVQPRTTGQLLIGSSRELVGWETGINRTLMAEMLRRAQRFLPGLGELELIRVWTGFRPATEDKLPLIGLWEEVPDLWIASGHEGLGITTATGTARILTDLILGHPPPIDAAAFAPGRVRENAAEEAG